jgi:hypothetical protein
MRRAGGVGRYEGVLLESPLNESHATSSLSGSAFAHVCPAHIAGNAALGACVPRVQLECNRSTTGAASVLVWLMPRSGSTLSQPLRSARIAMQPSHHKTCNLQSALREPFSEVHLTQHTAIVCLFPCDVLRSLQDQLPVTKPEARAVCSCSA